MMRWILFLCVVTIICLDVPEIEAMKCFWPGKSKKRESNVRNLQSNTSSSRPTPSSDLYPFQGNLQPQITSGMRPSTSSSQPSSGGLQPTISSSSQPNNSNRQHLNTQTSKPSSGLQPLPGHLRQPINSGIRPSTSSSQPTSGGLQPTISSSSRPSTSINNRQQSNTQTSHIISATPRNTGFQHFFMRDPNAVRRLTKELRNINKNPSPNCSAGLKNKDNLFQWIGTINGPENSPYEGGVFKLSLSMPENYPSRPPIVKFLTKIYHCNIDSKNGSVCVDVLKSGWKPVMTVSFILLSIYTLLINPNPENPLEFSIARLYKNNLKQYYENARQWTEIHAKPHE